MYFKCPNIRDGVLVLVLVLVLTRVLFSVLSCTLYLAKIMSTCTRTYLSTVTKNPVLMSTLRVLLSTFLNFNQIGKKVNCFSGPPSSVSNAPHLYIFRLEKSASSIFLQMPKSKYWHLYV